MFFEQDQQRVSSDIYKEKVEVIRTFRDPPSDPRIAESGEFCSSSCTQCCTTSCGLSRIHLGEHICRECLLSMESKEAAVKTAWIGKSGTKWELLRAQPAEHFPPTRRERQASFPLDSAARAPVKWQIPPEERKHPISVVLLDGKAALLRFLMTKKDHVVSKGKRMQRSYVAKSNEDAIIPAYGNRLVSTGLALELAPGYLAEVTAVPLLGAGPFTVEKQILDSSVTKELIVRVHNHSDQQLTIRRFRHLVSILVSPSRRQASSEGAETKNESGEIGFSLTSATTSCDKLR